MLNLSLWVFLLFFVYLGLIFFYYFFGKVGLFCYNGIITIVSSIVILRHIEVLGFRITIVSITFMSTLFTVNLITEKYGKLEAIKSINLALLVHIIFFILMNFTLIFEPNEFDVADVHLKSLFGSSEYIILMLVGTYIIFISGVCSALIYSSLRKRKITYLWIPHNVSRIAVFGIIQVIVLFFIDKIFLFFFNENMINFTEGSLLFTGVIMIFDTFVFYFINKLKVRRI